MLKFFTFFIFFFIGVLIISDVGAKSVVKRDSTKLLVKRDGFGACLARYKYDDCLNRSRCCHTYGKTSCSC
uniref:Invertebrate defensins family profile domain-containing protein n=1 Tax=Globodera pallida TaxID=36090 RepID=A0A183BXF2_GLOPA